MSRMKTLCLVSVVCLAAVAPASPVRPALVLRSAPVSTSTHYRYAPPPAGEFGDSHHEPSVHPQRMKMVVVFRSL